MRAFVDNQRMAKAEGTSEKIEKKDRLLKKGWRCHRKGKYKKSLRLGLQASHIHAALSKRAEPTEVAFSTCMLIADSYFKLNKYDSALYAIEEYDGGYRTEAQDQSLDSLQIKILAKMLTCDTLKAKIESSIDSVKFDPKDISCMVFKLQSDAHSIKIHLRYWTDYDIMGQDDHKKPPTKQTVERFKIYFYKSENWKNICE
ncbi:MAG TPA: hypothetical protein VK826_12940 [Bacteroidia bacterium]|nr:hypothetical protein [Bacteroidia bacterium]